jgi:hypothetical protein
MISCTSAGAGCQRRPLATKRLAASTTDDSFVTGRGIGRPMVSSASAAFGRTKALGCTIRERTPGILAYKGDAGWFVPRTPMRADSSPRLGRLIRNCWGSITQLGGLWGMRGPA